MKKTILLLLAFLLLCAGCSSRQSRMQNRLREMAAKPVAAELSSAKAMYDEASKFVGWLEAHPEDGTPELLVKARDLRNKRALEIGKVAGSGVLEGINKALGGLLGDGGGSSIDAKQIGQALDKAIDKVLGVNDPRKKEFGCDFPDGVTPLTEGASKYCK